MPRLIVCCIAALLPAPAGGAEPPRADALGDPLPPRAVARLGTTRLWHGGLDRLIFSPDGKQLAVADNYHSRTISLWDIAAGKESRRLATGEPRVDSWAWQPNGRGIAVLEKGYDGSFRRSLLDFTSPAAKPQPLPAGDGKVPLPYCALAPAGNLLAVARSDERGGYAIEFWELAADSPVRTTKLLGSGRVKGVDAVCSARFTPDGLTFVAFSPTLTGGQLAILWDVATATERRRQLFRMRVVDSRMDAVAVSNDRLAIGQMDGGVRLYDLKSGNEQILPNLHERGDAGWNTGGVICVAFSPDGGTLATGGGDRLVRLSGVGDGKNRWELRLGWARAITFSPDGKVLAVAGSSGIIRVLDVTTGADVVPLPGHRGGVLSVAASADGRTAVTAGVDETVRIWDLPQARERRRINAGAILADMTLTPDAKAVLAGAHSDDGLTGGTIRAWGTADGRELRPPGLAGNARSLRLSADGRTIVAVSGEQVAVRDWPSGALRREFALPRGGLPARGIVAAVSADGRLAVTATDYVTLGMGRVLDRADLGTVDLWDVANGKRVRQFSAESYLGDRAVFISGGALLLADYLTVRLINVRTGRTVRTFAPQPADKEERYYIRALAVSPDGRTAYVGGVDGAIHAFEVASGGLRYRLSGHVGMVTGLAVTTGGRRLLSASLDSTVLVWDVSLPAAAAPADLDAAWEELASADAAKAYKTLAALAAAPGPAVRLLALRLPPAGPAPDAATLDRLVAELGSDKFAEREKAEAELTKLGELAIDGLRARLPNVKAPEQRRRVTRLLAALESADPPARLRQERALELLESVNTAESRALLAELAKGAPGAWLTRQAADSLRRATAGAR